MENYRKTVLVLAIVAVAALLLPVGAGEAAFCGDSCDERNASGCSIFTLAKGDQVYFGGNDDYINPDSYYWVDPGGDGKYGAIWIGTPDNVQQGVNEVGLAYDANGLPRVDVNPHPERKPVAGGYTSYPIQILQENATVAEVIDWVKTHQWHAYMHDQMHFADAGGDAVIISAGRDGEIAFTRKPQGDGFLVSTNFNVANPSNAVSYPCWRYDTATEALGRLVARPGELRVEDVAAVLDAVHQESGTGWTILTLLADLPNGKVYLYYFYQYDRPLVLDVSEQLSNPPAPGPLSLLFPQQVRDEAARRLESIRSRAGDCGWLGMIWLGMVAASLAAFLILRRNRREALTFWMLVVIILGPLGLLIWTVAGGPGQATPARAALLEAVGDAVPTTVAVFALLVVVALVPQAQSPGQLQSTLLLGLPLFIGLLLFHGPLLASRANLGYLQFVLRRLPHVVVAMILGLAGMSVGALPLATLAMRKCVVLPVPASTAGVFWAVLLPGTMAGGVLLWLYNRWGVVRGFRAWSLLALGETGFAFAGWRKLGLWILLSLAALVGSVVVNQYLVRLLGR